MKRNVLAALFVLFLVVPGAQIAPARAAIADEMPSAPWTEGPVAQADHPSIHEGIPYGQGRHMRVLLRVDVDPDLHGTRDLPVTKSIDLADVLQDRQKAHPRPHPAEVGGQLKGFELETDSLTLVEVDADNGYRPVRKDSSGNAVRTPMLVFLGDLGSPTPFDAKTNPAVTLQWVLAGPTDGDRHFFLYFDAKHHGEKEPHVPSAQEAGQIAASVGPGRGTRIYVPLHDDLGIPTVQDPRTVRITNLQGGQVSVDIYEYNRFGVPESVPIVKDFDVSGDLGTSTLYRYSPDQEQGALLLEADGLIMAEAASSVTASGFKPGTSRMFLPSVDGGYVGTRFSETPASSNQRWIAFCPAPAVPANEPGCRAKLNGGSAVTIPTSGYWEFQVPTGQPTLLDVEVGAVAVQRIAGNGGNTGQRALTLWPALDGPGLSTIFMGHALSEDAEKEDRLVLVAGASGAVISVRNLAGSRQTLADSMGLDPGVFTDGSGPHGWGTSWGRDWRRAGDSSEHRDGPARIRALAGQGMTVASGYGGGNSPFSALIPLQSSDGGLSYHFVVPTDQDGFPVGRIVIFAPYAGTNVVAHGLDEHGQGAARQVIKSSLLQDQYVPDLITEPGWWRITADRPVLAAWSHLGSDAFSGIAPGVTDLINVEVEGAQYSGYLFDLQPAEAFKTANTNSRVEFEVAVRNIAQTVRGEPIPDTVELVARTPPGWPDAQVIPSTIQMGPDAAEMVTVSVRVPAVDVTSGGATVALEGTSLGEPRLRVATDLRINFKVDRGVLVTADGLTSQATKDVADGESAQYLVEVVNTGGTRDRFDIEFSPAGQDWELEVTCLDTGDAGLPCLEGHVGTTPEISSGSSVHYLFEVTRASGASGVSRLLTQILATSHGDPSVNGGVRLLTTTETDRSFRVSVTDPTRVVPPASQTTFQIIVANDASVDEELRVEMRNAMPAGWEDPEVLVELAGSKALVPLVALNETILVPASAEVSLFVTQNVPAQEEPLVIALDHIGFRSALDAAGGARSADLRVVVAEVSGFRPVFDASRKAVRPGETISLDLTLESTGNKNQTILIEPAVRGAGTGWSFRDAEGRPSPWSIELEAFGETELPITIHVPHDAQPASVAPMRVDLHATTQGYPLVTIPVELSVAPEPRLAVEDIQATLSNDRVVQARLAVRNVGNVPLDLHVEWPSLPEDWGADAVRHVLLVGESANLTTHFRLAETFQAGPVDSTFRITDERSNRVLVEKSWSMRFGIPTLEANVGHVKRLAEDTAAYPVVIRNPGDSEAREVEVVLLSDTAEVDRVVIEAVLPGSEHVATLIGPAHDEGLSVEVRAAGMGDPIRVLDGLKFEGSSDDKKGIPSAGPTAALLALAWALRRRWRL